MMLSFVEVLAATGGRTLDAEQPPERLRVVTDTRVLRPGDLFVALRGERFDGHDFIPDAIRGGAVAVVVEESHARHWGVPAVVVGDTRRAYLALAAAARMHFGGRVAAVTGSAGKTTVKHLLGAILAAQYGDRIAITPANENNEIGVSKLLLSLDDRHDVAVIEMGARHPGEIAELAAAARPHVGILTNVGEAHLEFFGTRERLADTKWALPAAAQRAVLNAEDDVCRARAATLGAPPLWFGTDPALADDPVVRGDLTVVTPEGRLLRISEGRTEERPLAHALPGAHNRANLAAAITAAMALGVTTEQIAALAPSLKLPDGRYERIACAGGATVIYDAYNASFSGTCAALDAFASEPARRRIAVLAGMAELGDRAPDFHEEVGRRAARSGLDLLLVGGEYADRLERGARSGGMDEHRIVRFDSNESAARYLRAHASAGDVVLLKGSRRYRMEEILERLRA
jgi:UDP-N-acetylmuramoyl-tripeptide--D-alanyl-D-alanine ligase